MFSDEFWYCGFIERINRHFLPRWLAYMASLAKYMQMQTLTDALCSATIQSLYERGISPLILPDRSKAAVFLAAILLISLSAGCGGGGGAGTSTPLPPLPAGTFAIATPAGFMTLPPATGTYTDQEVQAAMGANPAGFTVGVEEADGTFPHYATVSDQAPSPGSPAGTVADTVSLYGRADNLAKVRVVLANSVLRSDGSYFMNGVIQIVRPSTQQQVPDVAFQFAVSSESGFVSQFTYSPATFGDVSQEAFDSQLKLAYLAVTHSRA